VQNIVEYGFDLACVSEPASVPESPHWSASANGLAAIVTSSRDPTLRHVPIKAGRNFIVVKCNELYIFSVYIAPSENNVSFHVTLNEMGTAVRAIGRRCIIAGDFNAKSTMWGGSRTDLRGSALKRWVANLDLRLINTGTAPTCVR